MSLDFKVSLVLLSNLVKKLERENGSLRSGVYTPTQNQGRTPINTNEYEFFLVKEDGRFIEIKGLDELFRRIDEYTVVVSTSLSLLDELSGYALIYGKEIYTVFVTEKQSIERYKKSKFDRIIYTYDPRDTLRVDYQPLLA